MKHHEDRHKAKAQTVKLEEEALKEEIEYEMGREDLDTSGL